jgi:hypothetical protein
MGFLWASPFAPTVALVAALAAVSAPEQPAGSIYVTTLPAGADVWIDDTYVGRSPVLAGALAPGKHAVTVTKTGWVVLELDVEVRAGATALETVQLSPRDRAGARPDPGSYVLRGVPHGAKVSVDGADAPPAGGSAAAISAGSHRVVVVTARGRITRTFDVLPGTTTEVVLHEAAQAEARSPVLAPVSAYLPAGVCVVEGKKIVVRYGGHVVVARFGEADVRYDGTLVSYAGAPQSIDGKVYLPIELLEQLRTKTEPEHSRR